MRFFIFVIVLKLLFNVIFIHNVVFISGAAAAIPENLLQIEIIQSELGKSNPESREEIIGEEDIGNEYYTAADVDESVLKGISDFEGTQLLTDISSELPLSKNTNMGTKPIVINRQVMPKLENLDLAADESMSSTTKHSTLELAKPEILTRADDQDTQDGKLSSSPLALAVQHLHDAELEVDESMLVTTKMLPKDDHNTHNPNPLTENGALGKEALNSDFNMDTSSTIDTMSRTKAHKKQNVFVTGDLHPKTFAESDLTAEESLLVATQVFSIDLEDIPQIKSDYMDLKENGTMVTLKEPQISGILEQNHTQEADIEVLLLQPVQLSDEIVLQNLHYLQALQKRTKDTLSLEYIEENLTFKWNQAGVEEWLHCHHDGQELLIGRRLSDFLIVNPNDSSHNPPEVVNIDGPITALECYNFWNFELYQEEGVVIVASQDKVLWYQFHPVLGTFQLSWQWTLGASITQLRYFPKGKEDYLLIAVNQTSVQLYRYHLGYQEFELIQDIYFLQPFNDFVLLTGAKDVVLAVSQLDLVTVYFMDSMQSTEFHLKQTVVATGIKTLAGFTIGGKQYLALTGYPSQILLYSQGVFKVINRLGSLYGMVEYFLPLPVKTHQDDLVLLVQHKQQERDMVSQLVWNGETFESGLPVRCQRVSGAMEGLDCLLGSPPGLAEPQPLSGSCFFGLGDAIFLITPGRLRRSRVYQLHFELLPENSEFLNVVDSLDLLNTWFERQHNMAALLEDFLATPEDELLHRIQQREISSLDYVETPEFHFSGEVQEIYLNDHLWSKEDTEMDLNYLIEAIEEMENRLTSTRQRRDLEEPLQVEYDELVYDQVTVEELEIEQLNGLEFYINQGVLQFPGEIRFDSLEVLKQADIKVQKREIKEDFALEGDLEFDVINDVKWQDFARDMVLRNQPQELQYLKVEGEVIVEDVLNIKSLNTLNFPADYLLANGPRSSVVLAEKIFVNNLTANAVDTEGVINGQNPVEAITLMDPQQWQGFPTFNHLEVSEKLELLGSAYGRNVDSSPPNPTLQESHVIEAACLFNQLQVNGPIVLKGNLDDRPLADLLTNIVQRPEDPKEQEIEIQSQKTFGEITFPIDFELQNNTISQIATDNFLTVHTAQTLTVNSLEGYVYFYNLTLKGRYDGINLTEVLQQVIMLDKPLDLGETQLVFNDQGLKAQTVLVFKTLNGLTLENNLQTLNEDLNLDSAEFEYVQGQQAEFSSDILGPGKFNNIELEAFVNERSWHEPPVQGNLFVRELIAAQGIQTDELHGINSEDLLEFLHNIDELPDMVLNGQIQVDCITVMGNVQLHKVNGLTFDEDIQMSAIWLNRQNHLATSLSFQQPMEVKGNLKVLKNYQGQDLGNLIQDMIFRGSNDSIIITAPKSFIKPVQVLQNSDIQAINGQTLENLALQTRVNTFQGSVKIKGNLNTLDLEVLGSVTGLDLKKLENTLYYDANIKDFVLKDSHTFDHPVTVQDLTVLGDFNELPDLAEFLDNMICKSGPFNLKGNITFNGRVTIEQGLYAENINGHNIADILDNLILIQSSEPVQIMSPITFKGYVKADKILVNKYLKTQQLNECVIEEWLNDTLRLDQDQYIPHYLQFAEGSLDGNSLNVHYINGLDMAKVITLNTPQTFTDSVEFSDVILRGVIEANGSVNGLNLEQEYNNTLMIYGDQRITTPFTIQSIEVLQNLGIRCLVNNKNDLNDVATLAGNLELRSPVYFNSLYSPQVVMKDLVTGIDFDKWFEHSMSSQGRPTQYVTGNWSTGGLTVKTGPHEFQYAINGFQPWQFNSFMRTARSYEGKNDEICILLREIWRKLQQKSLAIKYIEEDFVQDMGNITSASQRLKMFSLRDDQEETLLLLNADCRSYMLKWNATKPGFEVLNSYNSGYIDQVTVLSPANTSSLLYITNYESTTPMNCSLKGLNLWSSLENFTTNLERSFKENANDIYYPDIRRSTVLLLSKTKVKELNFLTYEVKDIWRVPAEDNPQQLSYRFLSSSNSQDIRVTNGVDMISFEAERHKKTKKEILIEHNFPPNILWSWAEGLHDLEPSLLNPNSSWVRDFKFSDFRPTLQRLLMTLMEKLNQQINITQLTIPESDLYDEHLINDFVTVVDQLEQQKIYPQQVLDINFDNISLPENPAQVLATRVLLTVWPKVEELQEIHGYLKDNLTHEHPVCLNITQTLGSLIHQVLKEAYPEKEIQDHNGQLIKIIELIRDSERQLQQIVQMLQHRSESAQGELLALASAQSLRVSSPIPTDTIVPKSEILNLEVGSVNNSLRILAVTKPYTMATPGQDSSIVFHWENLKGTPFQILPASKPHSLVHLRLGAETLLMFVENCCQVQVLRYQGTRGFVKFASFVSREEIQQLLTMALPQREGGLKHYLVLLTSTQMKFYEIVTHGAVYNPPNLPCP